MRVDEPKPVRIVSVPDPEELARPRLSRDQFDPLRVSIPKHEFERVDVPFKQSAQRQAARTNRTEDLAKG